MNDLKPESVEEDDKATTKQVMDAIPQFKNEKEYAQYKYDTALKEMLADPSNQAKIDNFIAANNFLYNTQDAYRSGSRRLLQRVADKEKKRFEEKIEKHISRPQHKNTLINRVKTFLEQL